MNANEIVAFKGLYSMFFRKLLLAALFFGLVEEARTQDSSAQTQVEPRKPVSFTTEARKSVVFIQTDCKTVTGISSFSGTGFLLIIPVPELGPRGFQYLVTNRHVVQPGIEKGTPCEVSGYHVRVTLKLPGKDQVASPFLEMALGSWVLPANDSVDLAISNIYLDPNIYEFESIPDTMLANEKTDGISEGDSTIFTGLFIQYAGRTKMEPIVRSGSIAMMPNEEMVTTLNKPGHVYLTEAHAFGGNSGSPMFVEVGGIRKGQLGISYRLLGVVAGELVETSDFALQATTTYTGQVDANSGISMVVPAKEIRALLDTPALKKARDSEIAKAKKDMKK